MKVSTGGRQARQLHVHAAMLRAIASVLVVLLLVAPTASAQVPPAPVAPTQAAIAAQASFDISYLLALYMTQLAASGNAPSQADIDEATRQYFSNGAAMTSIPSSGPGAAYFHEGAEVTAYPAPPAAAPPAGSGQADAGLAGTESHEVDAGVQRAIASGEEAGAAEGPSPAAKAEVVGASAATGPTCSPREIEAAIAIASQFARAAVSLTPATSCEPPAALAPLAAPPPAKRAPAPPPAAEPAMRCAPAPSALSRFGIALAGALVGGLVGALWFRARPLRAAGQR